MGHTSAPFDTTSKVVAVSTDVLTPFQANASGPLPLHLIEFLIRLDPASLTTSDWHLDSFL